MLFRSVGARAALARLRTFVRWRWTLRDGRLQQREHLLQLTGASLQRVDPLALRCQDPMQLLDLRLLRERDPAQLLDVLLALDVHERR